MDTLNKNNRQEVGFVKSTRDFLVYLDGFPSAKINDLVENDQGVQGWVNSLLPDNIEVLILNDAKVKPGELFRTRGKHLTVPVGDFLLGRAIDPLGMPIDGKGIVAKAPNFVTAELDPPALGINFREFIKEQFGTGFSLVDTLIPIGKGQRELVLGDARSGKTSFLIDIIVNQRQTGVICIYASIGKPISEVRNLVDILKLNQALSYTLIVAASSTDPAPLIFLTPQTAFTIAEYFQRKGRDVLLILDDLGTHAKIYREIALLGGRSPGRESYPGDIFYQHAHLLERAGNFRKEAGGGSITALPVIELNLNDFTTFIPTNLMAMTDGHLLFRSSLYNQGWRPAVDIATSVSRVGQQTQYRVHNLLSTHIKQVLAQAGQLETVSRFSFELPFETQLTLKQRGFVEELIKQAPLTNIPKEIQIVLLALPFTSFFQDKDRSFVIEYKTTLIEAFTKDPELNQIAKKTLSLQDEKELFSLLETVVGKLREITGSLPNVPVTPLPTRQEGGAKPASKVKS